MNRFALILALGLMPALALAEVPAPVAAALDICRTAGPAIAGRAAALEAAGWRVLPPDDRAGIAAALAPYDLVRLGLPQADTDLAERADLLTRAAAQMLDQAERDHTGEAWLVTGQAGAYLHIQSRSEAMVECRIAAPVSAADYALLLGSGQRRFAFGVAEVTELSVDGAHAGTFNHIAFPQGAFGAMAILPILSTPPSAVTE